MKTKVDQNVTRPCRPHTYQCSALSLRCHFECKLIEQSLLELLVKKVTCLLSSAMAASAPPSVMEENRHDSEMTGPAPPSLSENSSYLPHIGPAPPSHDRLPSLSDSEHSSYRDTERDISAGDYFFCHLGKRDVPSLFCRGYKFWKNKVKIHDDGEETIYFYCDQKKKPPNGVYCKASASARKVEDEEGNITYMLLRINNVHPGNF